MTTTFSRTGTETFTITHARKLAAKVATDLHLCSLYYGSPVDSAIPDYLEELALLLKNGYVQQYEFGFKKNEQRIICWRYVVDAYGQLIGDDRPGTLASWALVSGSQYYNHLWYSSSWWELAESQRQGIVELLPIQRRTCSAPGDGDGYWETDKTYAAGGRSLTRSTFRPYR